MTRQRDLRKEDLLLASRLARGRVLGAVAELGDRSEAIADSVQQLRQWLSGPLPWAAVGIGIVILAGAPRRMRAFGVLRGAWLAWRLSRALAPAWCAPVHRGPTGGRGPSRHDPGVESGVGARTAARGIRETVDPS